MSKLPATKSRKFLRLILRLGYRHERSGKGSHHRFYLEDHVGGDGNLTFVRYTGTIPGGTLNGMLRLISEHTGIPVAELREMLDQV
jgi:predicted RNA binding protein YcfA (HicA-like mRNA interferase family)